TAGFHQSFDCTAGVSGLAASYATAGTSASSPCTFADNGTYTVYGRIFDKNNGFSTYTTSVTVTNVLPTVTAASDQSSDEGSAKSFDLGSFTDPGVNDNPWKVHVDWGDTTNSDAADKTATGPHATAA